MPQESLVAECHFEYASGDDLVDAIHTVAGRCGQGVIVPPPGNGPDNPLAWSIQEVNRAGMEADKTEREKLCTNAMLNARRSLACLVDWYVSRDLADRCKNPPGSPRQKAEFLMQRGVIDGLTSRVLSRAIEKRNRVEHDYIVPDLGTAEDVVELLRRTTATIRHQSDPSHGPWIYGLFLYESRWKNDNYHVAFHGWCEPLVVFSRFSSRPWIGIVVPENTTKALVRRCSLADITNEQLVQLISLAEQKFGQASTFSDTKYCGAMSGVIGLGSD